MIGDLELRKQPVGSQTASHRLLFVEPRVVFGAALVAPRSFFQNVKILIKIISVGGKT